MDATFRCDHHRTRRMIESRKYKDPSQKELSREEIRVAVFCAENEGDRPRLCLRQITDTKNVHVLYNTLMIRSSKE